MSEHSDGAIAATRNLSQPAAHTASPLRGVISHWPTPDGAVSTAKDLIDFARTNAVWRRALLAWCPPRGKEELPTPLSVGCALRAARGVVHDGYSLDIVKRSKAGALWARLAAPAPAA